MDLVIVAGQLVLASILLIAGVSKLMDRAGSQRGIIDFGVDARWARPLAFVVPIIEMMVGAALLFGSTVRWGAVAALGVLASFTLLIALSLARGNRPDCHCFGALHSSRAGAGTLARNGILMLLAGLVATGTWSDGTPEGVVTGLADLSALGVTCAITAWLVGTMLVVQPGLPYQLLRQGHRVRVLRWFRGTWAGVALEKGFRKGITLYWTIKVRFNPSEGLADGSTAPRFRVPGLDGGTITLDSLLDGERPLLMYFADPVCHLCTDLLPEVAEWQATHSTELRIAVATTGSRDENLPKFGPHGLADVMLQKDRELLDAFQVFGTPSALLVHADGTIASEVVHELEDIRLLLRRALSMAAHASRAA